MVDSVKSVAKPALSAGGMRRRAPVRSNSKSTAPVVAKPKGTSGVMGLPFYSEDSTGLKMGPAAVLMVSLMYIFCVVLLHIYGKLTRNF
mmetsp:Transcript_14154/g.44562  ORF Transcript_14154/g.44562 Transcript_14154/m.44562 type:complete len:89 (+) Transcript_14154:63-329(+)|eukprot:CAMPEP_0170746806 /NCGR_PEP_ID=MMETSP0437-20130122/8996_1 /TAXON_ID=0 /ORGANISM="Sexangularia sp." /LENGTH=88 /DNA_ID=CAMNT_0011085563 /DNA_START=56 /DNA_END=322 /DNA_ORIENTATION=-